MKEYLEDAINRLGYALVRAYETDGIKTTLVLSYVQPDGQGFVTAFVNGVLQETPMAISMATADVADKGLTYGRGMVVRTKRARADSRPSRS